MPTGGEEDAWYPRLWLTRLRLDRLCLTYMGELPAGSVALPVLRMETRARGGHACHC